MSLEIPYFRQHRYYTCGPACLRMVLAYYGYETDEVSLTMLCRTTVFGTAAKAIVGAAQHLGFADEYSFRQDFSVIAEAISRGQPVIVAVDVGILYQREEWRGYKHMIVVVGTNAEVVSYHDPLMGERLTSPLEVFLLAWTAKESEVILIWSGN